MASVRSAPHDPSKWQVVYRRYNAEKGRATQTTRTFRTKREATNFAKEVDTDVRRGDYIDSSRGKVTFGEFAARWMTEQDHLRPKTRSGYEHIISARLVPGLGGVQLGKIDHETAQAFFREQKQRYAAHSVRATRNVARRIMQSAVAQGLIKANPFENIEVRQAATREKTFLTAAEVEALANAVAPHYSTLVRFAAYTGLRAAELSALRVKDFAPDLSSVTVSRSLVDVGGRLVEGPTKTGHLRTLGVPATVRDDLRQHLAAVHPTGAAADDLVFPGEKGGPHRHANFYKRHFRPAVARALPEKPDLRFHDLRHTCAALLIGLGAHPKEISERLGHSSIKVTMDVYGHVFPSRDEALTAALDGELRAVR